MFHCMGILVYIWDHCIGISLFDFFEKIHFNIDFFLSHTPTPCHKSFHLLPPCRKQMDSSFFFYKGTVFFILCKKALCKNIICRSNNNTLFVAVRREMLTGSWKKYRSMVKSRGRHWMPRKKS